MKRLGLGFVLATLALITVGCTGSDNSASNDPSTKMVGAKPNAGGKTLKIGMVFDSGGKGDKSFNDSAFAGLSKAEKDLGVEIRTVDSKSIKDYETNLDTLAEQGFDLVFAIGFTQGDALKIVAPKHPNTKFAIVDAVVENANVRSLLFSEEEGSYLAGYAAALASKTGKIGFVGGKKIPLIEKFEAGYKAGAMAANPKVVMLPSKYTESWDDTQLGKESAKVLFNDGADIVYHAAGRCGIGVITAAKDAGKWAIGVDSDQDDVEKGSVLTSMIKRVDESVFQTIKDAQDGAFAGGSKVYDLKSNGVGLSDFRNSKDKLPADLLTKLEAVKKDIVEGKVKVPTTLK
jgi:basic membrane protein A and related proteins